MRRPSRLIYVFCKKLGIELQANMEAVAKINGELKEIRRELELSVFGAEKPAPKAFDPLTDTLPAEIDAEFDKAIAAAKAGDEAALLAARHRIEAHFGFPAPNELVKNAEIPGGMYSNMVAQLKQLKAEEIPAPSHGADPHGASGGRTAAAGNPHVADRRRSGRRLRDGREGRPADVYDQEFAVRGARQGRIRQRPPLRSTPNSG